MSASVQLGDILEVQNGFAFKSEFFTNHGGIPLIRIRDLPNASTETNYSGEYRSEFLVQPGDFLIGMDGDFRCVRWSGLEGLLNQRVCRLRNFSAKAEPDFVFHAIGKKLDDIHSTTSFATVKHLSSKQILKIEIPLPSLSEQRRIVDILNRANGIRRLRGEAQEKARQVIPALFVKMFGDPQRNPKGFPITQLDQHLSFVTSGSRGWKKYYSDEGAKFIRVQNLRGGTLDFSDAAFVKPPRNAETDRAAIRSGDLVMSITGSVGQVAVAPDDLNEAYVSQHVALIRLQGHAFDPTYVANFVGHPRGGQLQLFQSQYGQTRPGLGLKQIRNIKLVVPPLELQQAFASRVADIQAMIAQQERMSAASVRLVNSLMAEMFQ